MSHCFVTVTRISSPSTSARESPREQESECSGRTCSQRSQRSGMSPIGLAALGIGRRAVLDQYGLRVTRQAEGVAAVPLDAVLAVVVAPVRACEVAHDPPP